MYDAAKSESVSSVEQNQKVSLWLHHISPKPQKLIVPDQQTPFELFYVQRHSHRFAELISSLLHFGYRTFHTSTGFFLCLSLWVQMLGRWILVG